MSESFDGATPHERLLAGARDENYELLDDAINAGKSWNKFNINHKDPLGNTALHLGAHHRSFEVMCLIMNQPGCVLNLRNNDGDTPLHLAIKLKKYELEELDDEDAVRLDIVGMVLRKMMREGVNLGVKDRNGDTAMDLIRDDDKLLQAAVREEIHRQSMEHSVRDDDLANDDDDDDGDASDSD